MFSALTTAFRALAVCVFLLVAGASCSRATKEGPTLAGSTSLQPFAEKWADGLPRPAAGLPIHVQGGGSTAGVQAAISGAAQIGMSSRALTAEEAVRVIGIPDGGERRGRDGYVSIGLVDVSIKALRLHGVEPTEANIDSGKYPLVRPFLFVVPANQQGLAKDFIDWVQVVMGRDPKTVARGLATIFFAKHIECMADHTTNVAEMVIYLVRGQDVRHGTSS